MRRLRWYPDLRIVAVRPCLPTNGSGVRAAPRLQWRDRAGIGPASRAQTRSWQFPRAGGRSWFWESARGAREDSHVVLGRCRAFDERLRRRDAILGARRRACAAHRHADEDVCAIGAGAQLAGVSEYTNAPCARGAVRVGNFAAIDAERIVALHPDAVMAIPAQRVLTAPLQRAGIRIVFAPDDSLHDIFLDIRTAGRITAHAVQASALVARLQRETAALRASERGVRRPSVFVVVQARPIWTVGPTSYISTLLQLAGARNAVTALARPYAQYNAEALVRLQPDAVVAASDLQSLLDGQPWISLRAVRQHHVFFLSDPDILERPGPRYNDGLRWLIARLRPLSR